MQSPQPQSERIQVPGEVQLVDASKQLKSPSDTISQLSQASTGGLAQLSSPIGLKDIGSPETPQARLVKAIDETAFENGYDSEGQRGPWEESQGIEFDDLELNEDDLPIGSPPSWVAVPSPENVAQKLCTVEDVLQMKVIELKTEIKLRGLSANGKKDALVARLK